MKLYIASRFQRRAEMVEYQQRLRALGHSVECRWLTDPDHRIEVDKFDENLASFNAFLAWHDLHDLQAADTLVFFAPGGTRGGCHVEFGMALASGKRLIWIGPRGHVFSWLPQVERFDTFEAAIEKGAFR